MKTKIGLEVLRDTPAHQELVKGKIAYLCHSASVNEELSLGIEILQKLYGDRVIKIFGPQHGLVTDVQDNMVETDHYEHPYFKLPVYSLYSETRSPTDSMLEEVDTFIVDLQDVGTRVYTYISTLTLVMKECAKKDIRVIVLDRPNPVGGEIVEGSVLEDDYSSFVGVLPIAQRHGMTMGEVGHFANKHLNINCDYHVIKMENWTRDMFWPQTKRTWVNPSPNLPTWESSLTFCGTVLYEGTNVSEGRGTTRSLEVLGHPAIEPFSFVGRLMEYLPKELTRDVILRPLVFMPTFQKHAKTPCGGLHIHPKNNNLKSWRLGQMILREFYHQLGSEFSWNDKPYEYENDGLAIDFINGNTELRKWVERNGTYEELIEIENKGMDEFMSLRQECLIY